MRISDWSSDVCSSDLRLKAEGDDKNWRRRRCDCCGRLCKTRMGGEKGGTMSEDRRKQASASKRDKTWLIRTYAGHSTDEASNAIYRKKLARGQQGLSLDFDLPTYRKSVEQGESVTLRVDVGGR